MGLIERDIWHSARLSQFVTLRAGGVARRIRIVRDREELADHASRAHDLRQPLVVLGWGSNVLPSDMDLESDVVVNRAKQVQFDGEIVTADTGVGFQQLCVMSLQKSLRGLEFAVGIPGTLGGALVSNAGAYRSEIADFVTGVEAVVNGHRAWFGPELLEFSYRDSIIRRNPDAPITLLRVRLKLVPGDMDEGYALARETQRKRILKQPPQASAGSFFKNVVDKKFAETLPDLDPVLREKGVVPAGFLIERAGLCGASVGGAMISPKHANFIVNLGGHEAGPIRALARRVRYHVRETFGVELEEEVLYLGTWPEE